MCIQSLMIDWLVLSAPSVVLIGERGYVANAFSQNYSARNISDHTLIDEQVRHRGGLEASDGDIRRGSLRA